MTDTPRTGYIARVPALPTTGHTLRLRLGAIGTGLVELDGVDISNCVRGLEIRSVVGELAEVKLLVLADLDVEIEADVKRASGKAIDVSAVDSALRVWATPR